MNCVRLWCRLDYEACMLVNTIADGTICGRGKVGLTVVNIKSIPGA